MDFYDKLFVCTLLIVLSIFSVFSTFCFAESDVEGVLLTGISANSNVFYESESSKLLYYPLVSGHTYTYNNTLNIVRFLRTSAVVPTVGAPVISSISVQPTSTYTFTVESDSFLFVSDISSSVNGLYQNSLIDVTPAPSGISGVVDSLVSTLNTELIWSSFKNVVPFVFITVVVVLGFYLLFKLIRVISKFKYRG